MTPDTSTTASHSPPGGGAGPLHGSAAEPIQHASTGILSEMKYSAELVFSSRLTWLLIAGPLAFAGSVTGALPESTCFALAGMALIPCAERLSFITEQVAAHTNGTIGALLNATFGNAPELLISTAALRAGYYRVIQLAMLGSILCNLLFVFGLSCLVGGLRWQVQDLRIVSGSVPIAVLLLSTAGIALPAALKMSGQIADLDGDGDIAQELIGFSRFDALVMMGAYAGYLTFQLGTHKEEYDDSEQQHERYAHHGQPGSSPGSSMGWRKRKAQRNLFCRSAYQKGRSGIFQAVNMEDPDANDDRSDVLDVEMTQRRGVERELPFRNEYVPDENDRAAPPQSRPHDLVLSRDGSNVSFRSDGSTFQRRSSRDLRSIPSSPGRDRDDDGVYSASEHGNGGTPLRSQKLRSSDANLAPTSVLDMADTDDDDDTGHLFNGSTKEEEFDGGDSDDDGEGPPMTFRTGIVWLFVITIAISSMSDILVETIDGFALKMHISEVFTSTIVLPFFSNIAEQVSAVIFAYRNEMDLCVGITVGSAAQIALMVMPGCVLVGWIVDRSMSMYLRGYETCCLLVGVLLVSAVLQGGTTNWLSGLFFMIVYFMMAAGFWFHELEVLDVDAEAVLNNSTGLL